MHLSSEEAPVRLASQHETDSVKIHDIRASARAALQVYVLEHAIESAGNGRLDLMGLVIVLNGVMFGCIVVCVNVSLRAYDSKARNLRRTYSLGLGQSAYF